MDALAALKVQVDWGADEALADAPIDRFAESAAPRVAAPALVSAPPIVKPAPRATIPVAFRAAQIAKNCATIADLRAALAGFTDCPLAATATNLVFADGNPSAGLVFVGDCPGPDEDTAGLPFVGAEGKLLDRMLASVGITRENCLLTTLIPWRPPGNRAPTEAEIAMCLPFLQRHLALLAPRIVVSLGALSTAALTGSGAGIRRLRGQWQTLEFNGAPPIALLPMFTPAYLRQLPAARRDAWADLIALRQKLDAATD